MIYPNPANEMIKVVTDVMASESNILHIYGVDGRLLKQQQLQKNVTEVDVRDLAKGVYIIRMAGNTNAGIIKFIKE
jgi:hypothetical protein